MEDAIPDRLSVLADVAEVVSTSHDLEETLENVIQRVGQRLNADVCSVYLTDPDLQHLTLRATMGLDSGAVGRVRLGFGDGLVGLAAQSGETVAKAHASRDPNYQYFPETGEERYESLVAAPMKIRRGIVGVLVIQSAASRSFDDQDTVALETCARLLAPVVMNAQLLDLSGRSEDERSQMLSRLTQAGLLRPSAESVRQENNVELRGIATARGVAIGPIHRLENPTSLHHAEYVPDENPEQEIEDLRSALAEARREIDEMRMVVERRFGPEFAAVFYIQVQILEDKGFVHALEEAVAERADAVQGLRDVLAQYHRTFDRIEDPYFKERGSDVEDVGHRILERLLGVRHSQAPVAPGSVVVVDQILPGLFARLEMDKVSAIVAEHGGATSHGAIFARTLEIPAVTGVAGIGVQARTGETAVVDGEAGCVYLSPDTAMLAEYESAQHRYAVAVEHLDAVKGRPAETRDGRRVVLSANVGLVNDLELVARHGAEGVGLFRTELLALAHRGFPSEEEQEGLYSRVCSFLDPAPLTIRTLDLGGDKGIPNIGLEDEENPQLGCRSIRLTLENTRAFRVQLRAILRSSTLGNVRLLLPMISGVEELREARKLIEKVKAELLREGASFDAAIPIGVMIEVPSAALIADALAAECDFFSIGTNDLTQYTLAVDRGNERVAHLYEPLHPAVLALIDRSVRSASRSGIPVSVCGEMATHPLAVPLLVGLGIGELSGTPGAVPVVKEIVRALNMDEVARDAREALASASPEEVHAIASSRLRTSGLLEHADIGDWLRNAVEEHVPVDPS
ncbi:MAG: phosphoenolpyruvate--protein phosphotransferase [Myxococcota bacterium]|nr:phosphoenolpyruvate--protein phosphotransferase [Myxococcota bacterium]